MVLRFDLHIHSQASADGRMSVAEILAHARSCGLNGVAITDHDAFYQPEDGRAADLLVIPGTEFSTEFGHLLGLFLTAPIPFVRQSGRGLEASGGVVELIEAIHAQGGLAVLAHPFAKDPSEDRILPLVPWLDGVEIWNGRANRHDPQANARAAAFAKAHGLPGLAGSDAHLPREIGNGILSVEAEACSLAAVKAAIAAGRCRAWGQNGSPLDVARSQYTKLQKTGAGLAKKTKWLAFAGKCAAQALLCRR